MKSRKSFLKMAGSILFVLLWAMGVVAIRPAAVRSGEARKAEALQKIFRDVVPAFRNAPWEERLWTGGATFFVARGPGAGSSETPRIFPEGISGVVMVVRGPAWELFPTAFLAGWDAGGRFFGARRLDGSSSGIPEQKIREAVRVFESKQALLIERLRS